MFFVAGHECGDLVLNFQGLVVFDDCVSPVFGVVQARNEDVVLEVVGRPIRKFKYIA